jgi:hypothetical protein
MLNACRAIDAGDAVGASKKRTKVVMEVERIASAFSAIQVLISR